MIGLAASEGRVFSAFEIPEQSYALVAFAPAINIDRDNHASIVTDDPANPDQKHVREKVALWNVLSGSSQIVTRGVATIPVYRDDNHFDGELDPGGPNNYSNSKAWAGCHHGENGDRPVARSADADAVHGGCSRRK